MCEPITSNNILINLSTTTKPNSLKETTFQTFLGRFKLAADAYKSLFAKNIYILSLTRPIYGFLALSSRLLCLRPSKSSDIQKSAVGEAFLKKPAWYHKKFALTNTTPQAEVTTYAELSSQLYSNAPLDTAGFVYDEKLLTQAAERLKLNLNKATDGRISISDPSNGLIATVMQQRNKRLVVFGGTSASSSGLKTSGQRLRAEPRLVGRQLLSNLYNIFGWSPPKNLERAEELVKTVYQILKEQTLQNGKLTDTETTDAASAENPTIHCVGHSKGGLEAAYASAMLRATHPTEVSVSAYCFAPAQWGSAAKRALENAYRADSGATGHDDMAASNDHIHNFVMKKDPVSRMHKHRIFSRVPYIGRKLFQPLTVVGNKYHVAAPKDILKGERPHSAYRPLIQWAYGQQAATSRF